MADPFAPGGADERGVAEEQAVDLHLRDRAGGEPDNKEPAARAHRTDTIEESVATDGIVDHLDALVAGDAFYLGQPVAARLQAVVGAQFAAGAQFVFAASDRDHRRTIATGDFDGCRSGSTRCSVNEDRLAGFEAVALGEGEDGRLVVHHAGRLLEGHAVGNRKSDDRRSDGDFGPTTEGGVAGDAITGLEG